MTKVLIALFVLFAMTSVALASGKDKEFNYLKNGVSFSLPSNWRTIADEPMPDKGFYFSAESAGKNTTGLFNLVTINTMENPVKTLLVQQRNMKEEELYKDSGIEFTAIENSRFGSMDAARVRYESVVKGTKVAGTIFCFNCSEKTYLIFLQSGMNDQKNNAKVFKLIEMTFACR